MATRCLIDGRAEPERYSLAIEIGNKPPVPWKGKMHYLGDGIVWDVSGVRYKGDKRLSFYLHVLR